VLNIFVLWGETDAEDYWAWPHLDNAFLVIFLFELVLRFLHRGLYSCFVTGKEKLWNVLDSTIVILGIIDLWVGPLMVARSEQPIQAQGRGNSAAPLLRFLRLLRLLRLLRVFKMIKRLRAFIGALYGMIASIFLLLMMLFMVVLIVAIVVTQAVRGYADMDIPPEDRRSIEAHFNSVQASFFTLFQVTTIDNWFTVAKPMIDIDSKWSLFFVVFIALCAWTMISVVTAAACDVMLAAVTAKAEKEREQQEERQKLFIARLRDAFFDADSDGSGDIDRTEFDAFLQSETLEKLFKSLEISFHKEEMRQTFDILDISRSGTLKIEEFVEGLASYQEGLSTKHVVTLDYSVRRLAANFDSKISVIERNVETLMKRNAVLLENMRKQEQVYQQQHCAIYAWQQWALQKDAKAFPVEHLQGARVRPGWLPEPGWNKRSAWIKAPKDAI
jgi:voltage-gated sodium channel